MVFVILACAEWNVHGMLSCGIALPSAAHLSASSFPHDPQWLGHHMKVIPTWRSAMILRESRTSFSRHESGARITGDPLPALKSRLRFCDDVDLTCLVVHAGYVFQRVDGCQFGLETGGEFASGITQHPASSSGSDGAITTPAPPFFLLSWTEPSV